VASSTGARADTTTLRIDAARTRVEVVGADRLTGEHVARIASPEVIGRVGSQRQTQELVVIADLTTLEMDNADVESFVKSSDFLDVGRYPEAVFRSTRIQARGRDRYRIRGVLTLHGVSREIEFGARTSQSAAHRRLHANFLLPRRAFAIQRDDALDALISSDFRVRLVIEAQLVERTAQPSRGLVWIGS
jgi:polyisoprenoid-binding protein YceI